MFGFASWISRQDARNIYPLSIWLVNALGFRGVRRKRATIRVFGKTMRCRVAHMGTIKESIFEDGYAVDDFSGDVLDCGANVGFSRMAIGRHMSGGRYLCVEPDPGNIPLLRHNYPDAELAPVAVSGEDGTLFFAASRTGVTGHIAQQGIPMQAKSIDTLVRESGITPALIKIDIEGAEYDALAGATATLRGHKPLLLIEIHASDDVERIRSFLAGFSYRATYKGNNIWQFVV